MKERHNLADRNSDPARSRHFLISAVRLSGAIMVMLGLLGSNGVLPLPDMVSYALIILGVVEFFVMPLFLAKRWSSRGE